MFSLYFRKCYFQFYLFSKEYIWFIPMISEESRFVVHAHCPIFRSNSPVHPSIQTVRFEDRTESVQTDTLPILSTYSKFRLESENIEIINIYFTYLLTSIIHQTFERAFLLYINLKNSSPTQTLSVFFSSQNIFLK